MQKENFDLRVSVQGLIALILVGTLSLALAGGPAIGVAAANGRFEVDQSAVYGNTTLFEGATVATRNASSRLKLNNGARVELGEDSRARIFEKRTMLERGRGSVGTSGSYQLEARTLKISPSDAKSIARVKLEGRTQVLVAAVNGPVRVLNEAGMLVANMEPGIALLFTPQAAQAGDFQMSGCLLQTRDGKFLLVDPNQTVEVRGENLAPEMNNHVEVTGTGFRSAVPTLPASQVVQILSLKRVAVGGCNESIAKLERDGVKVNRSGAATVGRNGPVTTTKSHTGIYVGVAVAAAGGIGAAVALGGKKNTSP